MIAKTIGVNKSTISRELNRNIPKRGIGAKRYSAGKAQNKTDTRHKRKYKKVFFSAELKNDIVKKVERIINNRPVRKFNYKTPNEVHLLKTSVALIA